jgi:hypothetical protein
LETAFAAGEAEDDWVDIVMWDCGKAGVLVTCIVGFPKADRVLSRCLVRLMRSFR